MSLIRSGPSARSLWQRRPEKRLWGRWEAAKNAAVNAFPFKLCLKISKHPEGDFFRPSAPVFPVMHRVWRRQIALTWSDSRK